MKQIVKKSILLACMGFALSINAVRAENASVDLGYAGFDMELDSVRKRLYVSVPERNEVVIISTESYTILNRVHVGSRPYGIGISIDGSILYIALNGGGAVACLNLTTLAVEEIVVGTQLGDSHAYDVVEAKPNRVFVSADANSSGFSYIVMIKRDENNTASRVADNQIIRAYPVFNVSPERSFLYIGEGFSPNSLYKLDLSQDTAPITLEDQHGSVDGTDAMDINAAGTRIYLRSGQVLRTSDFTQAGITENGLPKLNNDGSLIFIVQEPNKIKTYSTNTFLMQKELTLPYSFSTVKKLLPLPNSTEWIVLGDSTVLKFAEGPEIDVMGNRISISDGDNTPSSADGTDFSSIYIGTSANVTYSIVNNGVDTLYLTETERVILNAEAGCAKFRVTAQPEASIMPAGGSTNFTLSYSPTTEDQDICTVTIANSDNDENSYNFRVKGVGVRNKSWLPAIYQLMLKH